MKSIAEACTAEQRALKLLTRLINIGPELDGEHLCLGLQICVVFNDCEFCQGFTGKHSSPFVLRLLQRISAIISDGVRGACV